MSIEGLGWGNSGGGMTRRRDKFDGIGGKMMRCGAWRRPRRLDGKQQQAAVSFNEKKCGEKKVGFWHEVRMLVHNIECVEWYWALRPCVTACS